MTTARLGRLVIEGLGSVRELDLEVTTDVTVLIGANGSGKSNVIGALELISRIWDDSFQQQILNRGGMDGLIFEGTDGRAPVSRIEVHSTPDEHNCTCGYRVELRPADDDRAMLKEWFFLDDRELRVRFHDGVPVEATSSRARRVTEQAEDEWQRNFARHVTQLLAGCRVFHFDDVSAGAPVKGWSTVGDDIALRSDAGNIAAYLLRVKQQHPQHYRDIVTAVRHVTPFFDDFVLEPNPGTERIRLRWRQQGMDRTFMAREASDGTLRFICLATLLLGPDLPSTVVLDEPELGLHPAAITVLAEMVHIAGRTGHRVILATQSVPLLSHFDLAEVVVLERRNGATVATRPNPEELAGFLEDFSVGTMWEMNLLGGRPSVLEGIR
ncbi:chromosome segregation protein SMC [Arachnia propionica]|uniref:Chromosome segregation protein SMC n=1 Tax=Arachnia propionica TaxID=1750 RepID=A0A3P1TA39_9ACTN|nr:AAA family ATPase [Arachnia propionica]RRD06284.1 chromosome segregation protein SMC [Arachnia propionica]